MLLTLVLSTDLWKLVYFLEKMFEFTSDTLKSFIRDFIKFWEVSNRRMSSILCLVFHVLAYGTKS